MALETILNFRLEHNDETKQFGLWSFPHAPEAREWMARKMYNYKFSLISWQLAFTFYLTQMNRAVTEPLPSPRNHYLWVPRILHKIQRIRFSWLFYFDASTTLYAEFEVIVVIAHSLPPSLNQRFFVCASKSFQKMCNKHKLCSLISLNTFFSHEFLSWRRREQNMYGSLEISGNVMLFPRFVHVLLGIYVELAIAMSCTKYSSETIIAPPKCMAMSWCFSSLLGMQSILFATLHCISAIERNYASQIWSE